MFVNYNSKETMDNISVTKRLYDFQFSISGLTMESYRLELQYLNHPNEGVQ